MNARFRPLILVALGLAVGAGATVIAYRLLGPGSRPTGSPAVTAGAVWTCSMHPQIRMSGPGRCPICGMDLVPVERSGSPGAAPAPEGHLELSEHARSMAAVETVPVEERELFKEIRTVGKVDLDETRVRHIAARVDGRVDGVFVNFPGIVVKEGDHLVRIYSPDLLATQHEFLLSLRHEKEPGTPREEPGRELSASARDRLLLWGLTEDQLEELARTGRPQTHVTVHAPLGGTVIRKDIREGQYVKEGDSLYTIADLRHVWLILEVYEYEVSWVRFGQTVEVTLESRPGRPFTGTVGFVEPLLNESTRTVRARVVLANEEGMFKPGMYAQALIRAAILPDGTPGPTGLEGKYVCPMHPYLVSETPGKCSVCAMELEQVPGKPGAAESPPRVLAVPSEAVLTTGRRSLVYVEERPGVYRLSEPALGPRAGDFYPVLSGLEAGQRVVTRGNFLLDSQFQISGRPSLLYPQGAGAAGSGAHGGHRGEPPPAAERQEHQEHRGH